MPVEQGRASKGSSLNVVSRSWLWLENGGLGKKKKKKENVGLVFYKARALRILEFIDIFSRSWQKKPQKDFA